MIHAKHPNDSLYFETPDEWLRLGMQFAGSIAKVVELSQVTVYLVQVGPQFREIWFHGKKYYVESSAVLPWPQKL